MNTEHLYNPVGDIIADAISRELPVRLTDLERLELADRKAAAEDELVAHQNRMAEQRREMAKHGSELARRIADMGTALRERRQRCFVLCYERWANGQIEVVRRDVDPRDQASIVDRRPATLEESQRAITGLSGAPPTSADKPESPAAKSSTQVNGGNAEQRRGRAGRRGGKAAS